MAEEKKLLTEKVYYEDSDTKITNVRVTCRHLTVPVEKIGSVNINYKVETFSLSVMCLIVSATPFMFINSLPKSFGLPVASFSVVLMLASLLWLFLVFRSYAELIVAVDGRGVKMSHCNMFKKAYIEEVCSKIGDAILDERKYRQLKAAGVLEESLSLNPSETLRLKMIIDDYEDLKNMKEEFSTVKDETKKE